MSRIFEGTEMYRMRDALRSLLTTINLATLRPAEERAIRRVLVGVEARMDQAFGEGTL